MDRTINKNRTENEDKSGIKRMIKTYDELSKEELHSIFRLRSEIFVVEQECVYNDLDDKDKKAMHLMFTEKDNDELIAYARIFEINKEHASFGRICVRKDFRKSGIGRRLVEEAINAIKLHFEQKEIFIEAQAYLKRFYESFGFKATSKEYLDDGIPHINMILKM